jgi:hypothetical protein
MAVSRFCNVIERYLSMKPYSITLQLQRVSVKKIFAVSQYIITTRINS